MITQGLNKLGGLLAQGLNTLRAFLNVSAPRSRTACVVEEVRGCGVPSEGRLRAIMVQGLRADTVAEPDRVYTPIASYPYRVAREGRRLAVAEDRRAAVSRDRRAVRAVYARVAVLRRSDRAVRVVEECRRVAREQ